MAGSARSRLTNLARCAADTRSRRWNRYALMNESVPGGDLPFFRRVIEKDPGWIRETQHDIGEKLMLRSVLPRWPGIGGYGFKASIGQSLKGMFRVDRENDLPLTLRPLLRGQNGMISKTQNRRFHNLMELSQGNRGSSIMYRQVIPIG